MHREARARSGREAAPAAWRRCMRSGGSGGGLPHTGEVRLGWSCPTAAQRASRPPRALFISAWLWPVRAIDASAGSRSGSAPGRKIEKWVCLGGVPRCLECSNVRIQMLQLFEFKCKSNSCSLNLPTRGPWPKLTHFILFFNTFCNRRPTQTTNLKPQPLSRLSAGWKNLHPCTGRTAGRKVNESACRRRSGRRAYSLL